MDQTLQILLPSWLTKPYKLGSNLHPSRFAEETLSRTLSASKG